MDKILMNKKIFYLLIIFFLPSLAISSETEPLLREIIPAQALAYVRIPNPWSFTLEKENAFKNVLANKQHKQYIQQLESAIYQQFLKPSEETYPELALLLHHLRSPIEMMALQVSHIQPRVFVSAELDFDSLEEFNQFLEKIIAKTGFLTIQRLVSTTENGILMAGPISIFVKYNPETHKLNLMGGIAATEDSLEKILELPKVKNHPMYEMENQLDSEHQGLFTWINAEKILPFLQMAISFEIQEQLGKWGLLDVQQLAFGWGVANGKGRLGLTVKLPKTGYREFFPVVSGNLGLNSAGKPGTIVSFSLSVHEWLLGFEKILATEIEPKSFNNYQKLKQNFTKKMGFSVEDASQALGSQLLFFTDEVGEFMAIKIDDKTKLESVIKILAEKETIFYETRSQHGKIYHHLSMPSWFSDIGQQAGLFAKLFSQLNTHYYWIEEDGYLIFSLVPQSLFDRQFYPKRFSMQQWLTENQRQNNQHSLLLISTHFTEIPRHLYYTYLQFLSGLGDILGTKIDLFALPSAIETKLPKEGTYGFKLDIADTHMGFELTFESNPIEWLMQMNMTSIAFIGVAAAVIIPAYADYTKRSEVAQKFSLLGSIKTPAEEFLGSVERLPELAELGLRHEKFKGMRLLEDKNGYAIKFEDDDLSGELQLIYDFEKSIWKCTSLDIEKKYLPSSCK